LVAAKGVSTITGVDCGPMLKRGESLEVAATRRGCANARVFYKFWQGSNVRYNVPNNDIGSVEHAIVERVFCVKKDGVYQRPPANVADNTRLDKFTSELTNHLGSLSPCSSNEFCERYGGNKRKMYDAAALSLQERPLEWEDSKINAFTKAEYLKPGGCPRIIQPRKPRYNLSLGRYLSPNEHRILEGVNHVFRERFSATHSSVAKGQNLKERGKTIASMWARYDDPVSIGLDAARYDQHINELLQMKEHGIYTTLFSGSEISSIPLKTMLKWQRRNSCKWTGAEGKIKYKTKGCRMSGDMNTSLGNILIMTMLWYTYLDENKYNASIFNDGDDTCVICERKTANKIIKNVEDYFREFGITMVVEGISNTLEEIVFCQCSPVFDGNQYYLCPSPHKRCFSDLVTMKDMKSPKLFNLQLGAIAACGLASNGNTPILNSMYKQIGSGVELYIPDKHHHMYRFRQELIDGLTPIFETPTWSHRISFYFAFGITPNDQILIEKYYSNLPRLRHVHLNEYDIAGHNIPAHLASLEPTLKSSTELTGGTFLPMW
jgi:hypothetical protein